MNDERTKKRGEMLLRRRKVAGLYLRKVNETDIAARLEVSQATVSRDVKWLMQEWRRDAVADIAEMRGRELAELDEMERDAALQFASTKAPQWFLARLEVKKRRARLMGLDAPTKTDVRIQDLDDAIERELARVAGTGESGNAGAVEGMADAETPPPVADPVP